MGLMGLLPWEIAWEELYPSMPRSASLNTNEVPWNALRWWEAFYKC